MLLGICATKYVILPQNGRFMMMYMRTIIWLFIVTVQSFINTDIHSVSAMGRGRRAGRNSRRDNVQDSPTEDCEASQDDKQSFLWTMKGRDPPVYFYGTIHVPYTQVWNHIPENVKRSFQRADQVHFELDLMDHVTVSTLAKCQLLPQGEVLSNVIPTELYRRLKRHLNYVKDMMPNWMTSEQQGRGLYADFLFNAITGNWERKRPIWVMLMVNSLTESDIKARGIPVLDLYLAQEARRLSKKTAGVEDVSEQCIPLNGLNFTQVLFALNQTLRQHEHYRVGSSPTTYTTDDLIHHYNCGQLDNVLLSHDTAQVPNLVFNVNSSLPNKDLVIARQIDQYFRQELIYKRNYRMANRISRLLRNNPNDSFFFAFGAGHYIGNNTVIDILKRKGYDIENTPSTQKAYMGKNYENTNFPPLLADLNSAFPLPPVVVNGEIEYNDPFNDRRNRHRHRHYRRRNRKRNRDKQKHDKPTVSTQHEPQFKDLWVRLEATSQAPHSYLKLKYPADSAGVTKKSIQDKITYISNTAIKQTTSAQLILTFLFISLFL